MLLVDQLLQKLDMQRYAAGFVGYPEGGTLRSRTKSVQLLVRIALNDIACRNRLRDSYNDAR